MFFCKSKRHVWTDLEDARKCCNGHKRVVVFGSDVPGDAKNIRRDDRTGIRYARVWVPVEEESFVTY